MQANMAIGRSHIPHRVEFLGLNPARHSSRRPGDHGDLEVTAIAAVTAALGLAQPVIPCGDPGGDGGHGDGGGS